MKIYFYSIDVKANSGLAFGINFFDDKSLEIGLLWWNLIICWRKR